MAIIYRPGLALVFLLSVRTSRRIKICFNSNSKNMAPFGSPASRAASRQAALSAALLTLKMKQPAGFVLISTAAV
ncbi:hypothetical protein NH00_25410 [Enterobacter cancerogenus]|nr:hypothetical protein NH00_25410 [Enterobacter cancerogenus]